MQLHVSSPSRCALHFSHKQLAAHHSDSPLPLPQSSNRHSCHLFARTSDEDNSSSVPIFDAGPIPSSTRRRISAHDNLLRILLSAPMRISVATSSGGAASLLQSEHDALFSWCWRSSSMHDALTLARLIAFWLRRSSLLLYTALCSASETSCRRLRRAPWTGKRVVDLMGMYERFVSLSLDSLRYLQVAEEFPGDGLYIHLLYDYFRRQCCICAINVCRRATSY